MARCDARPDQSWVADRASASPRPFDSSSGEHFGCQTAWMSSILRPGLTSIGQREPDHGHRDIPEESVDVEPVVIEDRLYEVMDGKVVEKPNMGALQTEFATILANYLGPPARQGGFGRVVVEAIVRIDERTQYRPDVAFVSYERWPRRRQLPDTDPWEIVPDLAIEVVSKSNKAVEVLAKVRHYFQAGSGASG